ncbi:MAG: ABC transporter ATP-binding protein [Cellulosilyticaceae bacterium]
MVTLFIKYLKPQTGKVMLVLTLLFLQSLSNLFLPTLMSNIIDVGVKNNDTPYIWQVGFVMIAVSLLGALFVVTANFFAAKIAMTFSQKLRFDLFIKVESFNLQEFNTIGTSSLITRTTNDITQVQQLVLMFLRMMVTAPLMIIGGIIMALITDAKLSILLLIALPVLIIVIAFVGKKGSPLFNLMQKKVDNLNLVLRENLTGIRVIRAFNKTEYEQDRFKGANLDLTDNAIAVNKIIAFLMPSMMFILNFTTLFILWFGGERIDTGSLQVGSLIAFVQYVMQIMMSLVMLTMMFIMIPRANASAIRINEVLNLDFTIDDITTDNVNPTLHGTLEFKNVSFSYPGGEEAVLSNISFKTNPGQTTAIIGGTGSGKSTLINLIPRFYDATSGEVLVDGVNVNQMSQRELRSKIGLVPQKAILFSGTLRENLSYGLDSATTEEMWHALDVAQSSEFVKSKPNTLDTPVSQGGSNFSGGQKQRLSIARALLRKPEIYIFDDSFSALDFKTDANLRKALKEETKNSAVIIVGQRISSIMDADEIIVLLDGHIAGKGSHQSLLENCEVYKEIALSQLSKEEIENA